MALGNEREEESPTLVSYKACSDSDAVLEKSSNGINDAHSKSSILSRRAQIPFFRLSSSLTPLQSHGPASNLILGKGEIKEPRATDITVDGQSVVDTGELDVRRHATA